jgi:general L-amino acid transport system substrate-binding protein
VADDSEAQRQYWPVPATPTPPTPRVWPRPARPWRIPENHIILPEIISKEPLGPVVRHGDNNWGDIVRWTYFALLIAEEKGITKANIEEVIASTDRLPTRKSSACLASKATWAR